MLEAGKDEGLIPAGFGALDLLRIEAGLILFGNEFDGQQDPFEAGIGFAVPLKTKTDEFIGKENLIKRKENPQKKLVGLELIGKEKANLCSYWKSSSWYSYKCMLVSYFGKKYCIM